MFSTLPSSKPSSDGPAQPDLRWIHTSSSYSPSRHESASRSRASSPPFSLASLKDALNSNLPLLPKATNRSSPQTSRRDSRSQNLTYQPSVIQSLAQSTLPATSLSYTDDGPPIADDCVSVLASPAYSLPPHASLEMLRSVQQQILIGSSRPSKRLPRDNKLHSSSFVPSWWWSQSKNKENVDHMLVEEDRADTVEQEQAKIKKKYLATRSPIVFCHGLMGFDSVKIGPSSWPLLEITHWRGIKEVLTAAGCDVLITRVPATSSPSDRATVLEKQIEEVYPGKDIHLIGHSMGGLDCRWLTTHLTEHTFRVLSVTTISTPHHGSAFAEHFINTLGKRKLTSFISILEFFPMGDGDGSAFKCLTPDAMCKFNDITPDKTGVQYFSWGAQYEPGLLDTLRWPHSVVLEKEGPNDGFISVASSKWGTYLGTLTDVNHSDLIGWVNVARYKWAQLRGNEIQFKPATFYLGIADLLAREVEGQAPHERLANCEPAEGQRAAERYAQADAEELGRQVADEGSSKTRDHSRKV